MPSRPRGTEIVLVAGLVVGTAGWMATGVLHAERDQSEHQEEIRLIKAGELDAVPESRRFEAREQIVDANLSLVQSFLDSAAEVPGAPEPAELALAVESLVESRAAAETRVRETLGRLREALERLELEEGFLDIDLGVALELIREFSERDEEE